MYFKKVLRLEEGPVLTIFVGRNHKATNYLQELLEKPAHVCLCGMGGTKTHMRRVLFGQPPALLRRLPMEPLEKKLCFPKCFTHVPGK